MAVRKKDPDTGRWINLTDRELKAAVIEIKGWSSAQYQREYDKYRNRVRNYEKIVGAERGTIKANEEFYRTIKNEAGGYALTAQQQLIKSFSSTSTGSFDPLNLKAQSVAQVGLTGEAIVASKDGKAQITGYTGGVFSGLLSKSDYAAEAYQKHLARAKAQGRTLTADDINKFLGKIAKRLHTLQDRELARDRAAYSDGKQVGSF